MNALALSLLGLAPLPGSTVRPKHQSKFPPVPFELYAMVVTEGTRAQRAQLHEKRLAGIEKYVRENGPMRTGDLADTFGLIPEVMVKELKILEEAGRISKSAEMKPTHWEAA